MAGRATLSNMLSGSLRKRHLSKYLKEVSELAMQIFRGRVFQVEGRAIAKTL